VSLQNTVELVIIGKLIFKGVGMVKHIKEGMKGSYIEKLRRTIIKLCYWYYVKSESLVPDRTFDIIFDELKQLEQIDDPVFYPTPYSPTQMIYGDLEDQYPKWAKIRDMYVLYDDQIPKRPVMPRRPTLTNKGDLK